jgi:fructose-1,6-bisphosphatase/inositol monophosphatase family enzyme
MIMIMIMMLATFPFTLVLTFSLFLPVPQDHAPGSLFVEEVGGIISDSRGRPLDFGRRHTLGENFGVVAAR